MFSLGLGLKTKFFGLGLGLAFSGLGLELCGLVNNAARLPGSNLIVCDTKLH